MHFTLPDFRRKLPELKFKFFREINAFLHEERIHGINSRPETVIARQLFHGLFKLIKSLFLARVYRELVIRTVAISSPNGSVGLLVITKSRKAAEDQPAHHSTQ
jgi:hypothetical protein